MARRIVVLGGGTGGTLIANRLRRQLAKDDVITVIDRDDLLARLANHRIRHQLAQIAADGSHKLPVRVLPVLRAERDLGHLPCGAIRILAAWLCHLRGAGAPVDDQRAREFMALASGPLDAATRQVLTALDPALGEDGDLLAAIYAVTAEMCRP